MNRPVPGPEGPKGDKGEPGEGMTAGARNAFVSLAITVFLLSAAALAIGFRQVDDFNTQEAALRAQQTELQSQQQQIHTALLTTCGSEKSIGDLAHVKVVLNPVTHKASKQLLGIIAAHRAAWHGLGCSGHLRAPSPSYAHWAKVYKLPAN